MSESLETKAGSLLFSLSCMVLGFNGNNSCTLEGYPCLYIVPGTIPVKVVTLCLFLVR